MPAAATAHWYHPATSCRTAGLFDVQRGTGTAIGAEHTSPGRCNDHRAIQGCRCQNCATASPVRLRMGGIPSLGSHSLRFALPVHAGRQRAVVGEGQGTGHAAVVDRIGIANEGAMVALRSHVDVGRRGCRHLQKRLLITAAWFKRGRSTKLVMPMTELSTTRQGRLLAPPASILIPMPPAVPADDTFAHPSRLYGTGTEHFNVERAGCQPDATGDVPRRSSLAVSISLNMPSPVVPAP